MLPAVGVDAQDVRSVLANDEHLLRCDSKLVHVGQIHEARKAMRRATRADRIGERPLFDALDVLFIQGLVFVGVWWRLSDTCLTGAAVLGLNRRGVEDGRAV